MAESGSRRDNGGERDRGSGEEGQRKRYTCTRDTTYYYLGERRGGGREGRRLEPAINRLNLPLDSPF